MTRLGVVLLLYGVSAVLAVPVREGTLNNAETLPKTPFLPENATTEHSRWRGDLGEVYDDIHPSLEHENPLNPTSTIPSDTADIPNGLQPIDSPVGGEDYDTEQERAREKKEEVGNTVGWEGEPTEEEEEDDYGVLWGNSNPEDVTEENEEDYDYPPMPNQPSSTVTSVPPTPWTALPEPPKSQPSPPSQPASSSKPRLDNTSIRPYYPGDSYLPNNPQFETPKHIEPSQPSSPSYPASSSKGVPEKDEEDYNSEPPKSQPSPPSPPAPSSNPPLDNTSIRPYYPGDSHRPNNPQFPSNSQGKPGSSLSPAQEPPICNKPPQYFPSYPTSPSNQPWYKYPVTRPYYPGASYPLYDPQFAHNAWDAFLKAKYNHLLRTMNGVGETGHSMMDFGRDATTTGVHLVKSLLKFPKEIVDRKLQNPYWVH